MSKSLAWLRTKTSPLIELEPPNMRPRGPVAPPVSGHLRFRRITPVDRWVVDHSSVSNRNDGPWCDATFEQKTRLAGSSLNCSQGGTGRASPHYDVVISVLRAHGLNFLTSRWRSVKNYFVLNRKWPQGFIEAFSDKPRLASVNCAT